MRLILLRDLHFICISIDAFNSRVIDFDISKWHCGDLSSYETITLLLQSQRLNQMRVTPLAVAVYLSQLPNPSPSHHLSSICLPECLQNKGCFIFFYKRLGEKQEKHFHSVEIGNDILIYINIKQVFQMKIDQASC